MNSGRKNTSNDDHSNRNGVGGRGGGGGGGSGGGGGRGSADRAKVDDPQKENLPLCLWDPYNRKGISHLLKDYTECPLSEKEKLYAKHPEQLARDGLSISTRFQMLSTAPVPATPQAVRTPKTVKLKYSISSFGSPSCPVEVSDGFVTHTGLDRCDDGSGESIVSPGIAQAAV